MSDKFVSKKNSSENMVLLTQKEDKTPKKAGPKSYIEGWYLGAQTGLGKQGNSTIHSLKAIDVEGKKLDEPELKRIWGSHVLNDMLDRTNPGEYIRVTWLGLTQPKKGGNEFHDWDVGAIDSKFESQNNAASTAPTNEFKAEAATEENGEEEDDLPF
jgi:hypothetical protein